MKKTLIAILVLIVIILILLPKRMGYDGGFTGGESFYSHCIGYVYATERTGPPIPDGINSTAYCIGIRYDKVQ